MYWKNHTEHTRINYPVHKKGKAGEYCPELMMESKVVVLYEGFVLTNVIHQMCGYYNVAVGGARSQVQNKKSDGESTDMVGE